jgi:hypothetical protein
MVDSAVGSTDTSFISLPQVPHAIEMGGAVEGGNSDIRMARFPELLEATVITCGAVRELLSRGILTASLDASERSPIVIK